jgi:hypothetical protein
MDEQEKEIEEILRTFDKAPSPSSENSVQNQAQQNNKQPRQISQKPTDTERTARTSNQTETKDKLSQAKWIFGLKTNRSVIKGEAYYV